VRPRGWSDNRPPGAASGEAHFSEAEAFVAIDAEEPDRRDFLTLAASAFVAVGGAATLWPFIDQMNPDAGALALASIEVDISPVKEGQAITVLWRGKPIFIRHRTAKEIEEGKAVDVKELRDEYARNESLPADALATDINRTKPGHENWIIMIGICTHLGCIPKGQVLGDKKGDYDGWFCPCHGSHYDTAGRIRKGPAPRNLEIPVYEYLTDTKLKIG
jgi:ubiquinol-cytochrome c reductase iron-sulfur subunit